MSFPDTRKTLIERISSEGSERQWRVFFADYWDPICRFAMRQGCATREDAEDVAAETFEAIWNHRLLARWVANRSAKLRTLLCTVVRQIVSNRRRVEQGRAEARRKNADELAERQIVFRDVTPEVAPQDLNLFYDAWAEALIQKSVESLARDYHREGKGDYVRVLYGRLCEQLKVADLAESLQLKPSDVDNYYRNARKRLSEKLHELVRRHVERYLPGGDVEDEVASEWKALGDCLLRRGGLEEAVQAAYLGRASNGSPSVRLSMLSDTIRRSKPPEGPLGDAS